MITMKTLFELKCPSCGANLDYEEGMEFIFCKYCGIKILLNDENTYTLKNIDYAEIERAKNESKRINIQESIINREYEKEEKETRRYNKNTIIFAGVLVLLILIFFISIKSDSDSLFGLIMMDVVLFFVLFLWHRGDSRKEKEKQRYKQRMRAQGVNIIELSPEVYDYENKDFNVLWHQFDALGFKNIKTIPLGDLSIFTGFRSGKVEDVRINGEPLQDAIYYEDDPVIIKYHSK